MKRLTDNNVAYCIENNCYMETSIDEVREATSNAPTMEALYIKLNKYEKLEQELGCPLDVLFEALKQGIYDKTGFHYDSICLIEDKIYACPLDIWEESWYLVDYGKTWWLKENKEE